MTHSLRVNGKTKVRESHRNGPGTIQSTDECDSGHNKETIECPPFYFTGEWCLSKKKAKHSAAREAMMYFDSTSGNGKEVWGIIIHHT